MNRNLYEIYINVSKIYTIISETCILTFMKYLEIFSKHEKTFPNILPTYSEMFPNIRPNYAEIFTEYLTGICGNIIEQLVLISAPLPR